MAALRMQAERARVVGVQALREGAERQCECYLCLV